MKKITENRDESPRSVHLTSPIPIIPKSSPSVASKQQGRPRSRCFFPVQENSAAQHSNATSGFNADLIKQVADDSYDYNFRIFPMDEDIEEEQARIASEARSFNFG